MHLRNRFDLALDHSIWATLRQEYRERGHYARRDSCDPKDPWPPIDVNFCGQQQHDSDNTYQPREEVLRNVATVGARANARIAAAIQVLYAHTRALESHISSKLPVATVVGNEDVNPETNRHTITLAIFRVAPRMIQQIVKTAQPKI